MTFDEWWKTTGLDDGLQDVARQAWEQALGSLDPPRPVYGPRSGRWPTVRRRHLDANPKCLACGSADSPEVHHVKPFHLYPELELDPGNLVTLCDRPGRSCHLVFGHVWDWQLFNGDVRAACSTMRLWRGAAERAAEKG